MDIAHITDEYGQTQWMQHFSIRLMQLRPGMHASLAMKLAGEAWIDAHERVPEDAARKLPDVPIATTLGGSSRLFRGVPNAHLL